MTFTFPVREVMDGNILGVNMEGGRVLVVPFGYNPSEMPAEEPSRVIKQADGSVGLDFSKEDRAGVRDLGVNCIEVTEMTGSDFAREGKLIEAFQF